MIALQGLPDAEGIHAEQLPQALRVQEKRLPLISLWDTSIAAIEARHGTAAAMMHCQTKHASLWCNDAFAKMASVIAQLVQVIDQVPAHHDASVTSFGLHENFRALVAMVLASMVKPAWW